MTSNVKARDVRNALRAMIEAAESGSPDDLQRAVKLAKPALASDDDADYTWEHMDAAACMWEHVLEQLGRVKVNASNAWADYKAAYGMSALREAVINHAVTLQAEWVKAHENGYDEAFDWEFVPKYMEDHVTRILT